MVRLLRTLIWAAALLAATLSPAQTQPKYRIVIMPKLVGIAYYDAVKTGVDAAAKELPDVSVTWTGPTQDQVERQTEMIERLIPSRPDLIAVAANQARRLVGVGFLRPGRGSGQHTGHLELILVDAEHSRAGLGTRLAGRLLAQAAELGLQRVDAAVPADAGLETFFGTLGFAEWGRRPGWIRMNADDERDEVLLGAEL